MGVYSLNLYNDNIDTIVVKPSNLSQLETISDACLAATNLTTDQVHGTYIK